MFNFVCLWLRWSFIYFVLFEAFTLFSASTEAVKRWDLRLYGYIRTFKRFEASVLCLAATVDADRLLSGHANGSVFLWDIATSQQLASVNAHSHFVTCLAVTSDGSSFVSGGWDGSLKLWRFKALQQPVIRFSSPSTFVKACVASSDGSRLYSGSHDDCIIVWDMTTGQRLRPSMQQSMGVSSLALSGSLLVSAHLDKSVKLWDTSSMQLLHTLRGHSDHVRSVAVCSDGSQRVLSCGGSCAGAGDYSVRVWDAASGAQLAVLQGHSIEVNVITVSSDSHLAASASSDGVICVWDLTSLSLRERLGELKFNINSLLFVPTLWNCDADFSLQPSLASLFFFHWLEILQFWAVQIIDIK